MIEIQHLCGTRNERYFAETVSVSCVQGRDKYLDSNVSTRAIEALLIQLKINSRTKH